MSDLDIQFGMTVTVRHCKEDATRWIGDVHKWGEHLHQTSDFDTKGGAYYAAMMFIYDNKYLMTHYK